MTTRDLSLDVARGIAIVLIVVGHIIRGLSAAGLVDPWAPWYEEADTAIYLVHLAVFFLISGLFVGRAVTRDGSAPYLRGRLVLLGWLFVVWTLLQGTVKVATGSLANTPVTLGSIATEFWHPNSQLWFLPSLATMTVIAVLLKPWGSRTRGLISVALTAVLSVAVWGISGRWSFTMGMGLLVFFVGGAALGAPRLGGWLRSAAALPLGLFAATVFATVVWTSDPTPPSTMFWPRTTTTIALGALAATAGTFALLALSRPLAQSPVARPVAYLGRRSLEIFLVTALAELPQ